MSDRARAALCVLAFIGAMTICGVALAQVDLDVTYIHRTPTYAYDAAKDTPAVGDAVTFQGHVKNWATQSLSGVEYRWELDGMAISSGTVNFTAGQEQVLSLPWTWTTGDHSVKLVIDPASKISETTELNNSVIDRTNGVGVGLWVEQSVYNYFHQYQSQLGVGSNSWEDWAQRQMGRWNTYNAQAIYPTTPQGVRDRVRIDEITVVPDGSLPLYNPNGWYPYAGNYPDVRDKTVDLMWGFPKTLIDSNFYPNHTTANDSNPFYFEGSLVHELGHARYLIDNYGFDVANNYNPSTGQGHDSVQITDVVNGTRQRIAGTSLMPFIAWNSVVYYDKYINNVMGANYSGGWGEYCAKALDLIASQRAESGNYNAPDNIGEFLQDLPLRNHVQFVNKDGTPIKNADVRVYQATGYSGDWYGKTFDDTPDLFYTTDSQGYILLPHNPFTNDGHGHETPILHDYGIANGEFIWRIAIGDEVYYRFQEVTDFNLEFWRGDTSDGYYQVKLPTAVPEPLTLVLLGASLPLVLRRKAGRAE